jgi:hypothetical protein
VAEPKRESAAWVSLNCAVCAATANVVDTSVAKNSVNPVLAFVRASFTSVDCDRSKFSFRSEANLLKEEARDLRAYPKVVAARIWR